MIFLSCRLPLPSICLFTDLPTDAMYNVKHLSMVSPHTHRLLSFKPPPTPHTHTKSLISTHGCMHAHTHTHTHTHTHRGSVNLFLPILLWLINSPLSCVRSLIHGGRFSSLFCDTSRLRKLSFRSFTSTGSYTTKYTGQITCESIYSVIKTPTNLRQNVESHKRLSQCYSYHRNLPYKRIAVWVSLKISFQANVCLQFDITVTYKNHRDGKISRNPFWEPQRFSDSRFAQKFSYLV